MEEIYICVILLMIFYLYDWIDDFYNCYYFIVLIGKYYYNGEFCLVKIKEEMLIRLYVWLGI